MSINRLNNYSVSDFNIEATMDSLTRSIRGKMNVSIDSYTTTTVPSIKVGSLFECSGSLIEIITGDESVTGSVSGKNYIYFNGTGFEADTTAPIWAEYKQGWYHPTNTKYRAMPFTYEFDGASTYNNKRYELNNIDDKIYIKSSTDATERTYTSGTAWETEDNLQLDLDVKRGELWKIFLHCRSEMSTVPAFISYYVESGNAVLSTNGDTYDNGTGTFDYPYLFNAGSNYETAIYSTLTGLLECTDNETVTIKMKWRRQGAYTLKVKERTFYAIKIA